MQRWLFITLLSTFSGSDLSSPRAAPQRPGILLWADKDLHPVCERPEPAGGVAEGPGGGAGHHHPEGLPGLEGAQELEPAAGVTNRHLHLLEALEGQEPHHGAQGAPQAGMGRHHHPEALQEVAGVQVAHRPRPQPTLGVAHLPDVYFLFDGSSIFYLAVRLFSICLYVYFLFDCSSIFYLAVRLFSICLYLYFLFGCTSIYLFVFII